MAGAIPLSISSAKDTPAVIIPPGTWQNCYKSAILAQTTLCLTSPDYPIHKQMAYPAHSGGSSSEIDGA
jgi:hypothetical protein